MKHLEGKRIKLISMGPDPDPIPPGATGTVRSTVAFGDETHLNMEWDDWVGRSLNLNLPADQIEVLEE